MAKRPSLKKQIVDRLNQQAKFGISKHHAKQLYREYCKTQGIEYNPARVPGIFSIKTMESYKEECIRFGEWAKREHGIRYVNDAKQYVSEYLQRGIDRGLSAWTLQKQRAALRKLYQDHTLASEVEIPKRRQKDVIRSRGQKAMDREFSEGKNQDLVNFCKGTGLRRREVQNVKVKDVTQNDEGRLVIKVRGKGCAKGGRPREVVVLKGYENHIRQLVKGRNPEENIFNKIPVRADIHGYRREYAKARYEELTGRKFDRNCYDKKAVQQVSKDLGHNRISVALDNYLK